MQIFSLICLLLLTTVRASETQCSPFHYQEQMIEKMIKLEILVQKMKDDMDATQQRVTEILSVQQEKWKDMQMEFDEMKKKNDEAMRTYGSEFDKMKDFVMQPTIVFSAKEIQNTSPQKGETLIFKRTILNDGNGYDNATGIFSTPVDGTYLFIVELCFGVGNIKTYVYYDLVGDGTSIKRGLFENINIYSCYETSAISILKAGARVWVMYREGSTTFRQSDDNYWNSFRGVLLHNADGIH